MRWFKVSDYSKERTMEVQEMIEHNRKIDGKPFIKTLVINDYLGYALVCKDIDAAEISKELEYIFNY